MFDRKLFELLPEMTAAAGAPSRAALLAGIAEQIQLWKGVRDGISPLQLLAKLTEWDRQKVFLDFLSNAPDGARPIWLWELGNEFTERGHYDLAASAFLQGALNEGKDPVTRAALLIKAAIAGTDGSLGTGTDHWLANGTRMLDSFDSADSRSTPPAVHLIRFMAYYAAARHHLFLDGCLTAEDFLQRCAAALPPASLRFLGIDAPASETPDILLLQARLARAWLEIADRGTPADIATILERAEQSSQPAVLLTASLSHHLAFQRATLLRLQNRPDEAIHEADVACENLTGMSLENAMASAVSVRNRRRLGGVFCLAGEVTLAKPSTDLATALKYLEAASREWTDPFYARGLSRVTRLHALALMQDGRRWSEASRLLSESIAHALGSRSAASEARAVASKIALHEMLNHAPRAKRYKDHLTVIQAAMSEYWPSPHRVLDALRNGHSRHSGRSVATSLRQERLDDARKRAGRQRPPLLGRHPLFLKALASADEAAHRNARKIIIIGESGTGKTELAKFIHDRQGKDRPFEKMALGAIQKELVSSELFGHRRGAFTNALFDRVGRIQLANGGTLFLDDITDATPEVQNMLKEVIETGILRRLGDNSPIRVDFTLITSTNKDIRTEIKEGRFQEDLFWRIQDTTIALPPLRARGGDIRLIAQAYLEDELKKRGLYPRVTSLTTNTWDEVCQFPWRGNIRQLRQFVTRIVNALDDEDLASTVNEDGEIFRDFVHEQMEDDRDHDGERVEREVLDTHIPISPEELEGIIVAGQFRTASQVTDRLKQQFPQYEGLATSIAQAIRRRPSFKRAMNKAIRRP